MFDDRPVLMLVHILVESAILSWKLSLKDTTHSWETSFMPLSSTINTLDCVKDRQSVTSRAFLWLNCSLNVMRLSCSRDFMVIECSTSWKRRNWVIERSEMYTVACFLMSFCIRKCSLVIWIYCISSKRC